MKSRRHSKCQTADQLQGTSGPEEGPRQHSWNPFATSPMPHFRTPQRPEKKRRLMRTAFDNTNVPLHEANPLKDKVATSTTPISVASSPETIESGSTSSPLPQNLPSIHECLRGHLLSSAVVPPITNTPGTGTAGMPITRGTSTTMREHVLAPSLIPQPPHPLVADWQVFDEFLLREAAEKPADLAAVTYFPAHLNFTANQRGQRGSDCY